MNWVDTVLCKAVQREIDKCLCGVKTTRY